MTIRTLVVTLSLAGLLGLISPADPVRAAAIQLTQIDLEFDGSPWTLGWTLTVTEPVFADALGIYDSGQDGLAGQAQVGLWPATGGEPLVQATVPAGTGAFLDNSFRLVPVSPTLLTPGVEYVIGAHVAGEAATSFFGTNGIADPRVTVIESRYSTEWVGFAFPELTDSGAEGTAFLGANLRLAPIPLPGAVWLFGSAAAGLIGLVTRRVITR